MDIKAVRNAMIYPVSTGITEGFANKLKTIKRVMYGKAKLPLLKIKMECQHGFSTKVGKNHHFQERSHHTFSSQNF